MTDHIFLPINHIERKPGSGKPRVAGHGITVQFLAILLKNPEWTVEKICENYGLTPAQVHAAWAFYYDHQEEIDRSIAEDNAAYQQGLSDPAYQAQVAELEAKHKRK